MASTTYPSGADISEIRPAYDDGSSPEGSGSVELRGRRSPFGPEVGDAEYGGSRSSGLYGQFNRAAQLKPGHLLVGFAARNAVFQVDPDSGETEYLFTLAHEQEPFLWRVLAAPDGIIYCTMSGSRNQAAATEDAVFGLAGAVVRVDHRRGQLEILATGDDTVDPCGLQIVSETAFCVSDFQGFGGSGRVYLVDRLTGDRRVLAQGGGIEDPVSAHLDGAGRLWIANAYMHYFYPERREGVQRDDGEVLCVENGTTRIVLQRQYPAAGSVVGIHGSNRDDQLIVVKGDWPMMEKGAVLRLDKTSGEVSVLLEASASAPRFYSTHVDVTGDLLWVGESYRKELICYDLKADRLVKTIPMGQVMGQHLGVASSFEGIESVSVVPAPGGGIAPARPVRQAGRR